jgi:hypothetical protein
MVSEGKSGIIANNEDLYMDYKANINKYDDKNDFM